MLSENWFNSTDTLVAANICCLLKTHRSAASRKIGVSYGSRRQETNESSNGVRFTLVNASYRVTQEFTLPAPQPYCRQRYRKFPFRVTLIPPAPLPSS